MLLEANVLIPQHLLTVGLVALVDQRITLKADVLDCVVEGSLVRAN